MYGSIVNQTMENFLTAEQCAKLKSINWDVKPDGCYVHLYRDEHHKDYWELMCYQAQVDSDIDKLSLLVFGTIVNF